MGCCVMTTRTFFTSQKCSPGVHLQRYGKKTQTNAVTRTCTFSCSHATQTGKRTDAHLPQVAGLRSAHLIIVAAVAFHPITSTHPTFLVNLRL